MSHKMDFKKPRLVVRYKKVHYIMIKGTIQQEDITLVNTFAPNIGAPKYVKQILMDIKGEIKRNTVIVGAFNIPLVYLPDRKSTRKYWP